MIKACDLVARVARRRPDGPVKEVRIGLVDGARAREAARQVRGRRDEDGALAARGGEAREALAHLLDGVLARRRSEDEEEVR